MPDTTTIIVGNLTDDPELRHTESGIARALPRARVLAAATSKWDPFPPLITPGQRQRAVQ